ncbi:HAD family hydrolase [Limnohabitans radicicola]|uniref:HAD-IA family hydrolase n=1 Tax=Limnohabitans radicicola TaxID=2771427 RepID=A0A927FIS7_9BURK|nr:HAD-IA family hydrolase [Limnohabitans radicicola]MBD8051378.1 HAD-IA family hydrolase [Limnohabitans radicicola]
MLDLSRIRAITLDLDDTLWPVWPTIHRAEQVLMDWLTQHAPATAALSCQAEVKQAVRAEINARHADRAHDLSFLRLEAIRALLVQAGDPGHLAEPAFEVFFAERQRVDLFDDALPALAFWSQRYPVVALSNGNADVHRVGIGQHFHASVSAKSLGVAKPDLRIFVAGAQAAGVAPHEVLHIGDDAHADCVGALAAGMQVAWLNREGQDWSHGDTRPHLEVRDLHQLCACWPEYQP